MAGVRQSAREHGKSDAIDAIAVARAALREGPATLQTAHLNDRALEIRLLLDQSRCASFSRNGCLHTRGTNFRCAVPLSVGQCTTSFAHSRRATPAASRGAGRGETERKCRAES